MRWRMAGTIFRFDPGYRSGDIEASGSCARVPSNSGGSAAEATAVRRRRFRWGGTPSAVASELLTAFLIPQSGVVAAQPIDGESRSRQRRGGHAAPGIRSCGHLLSSGVAVPDLASARLSGTVADRGCPDSRACRPHPCLRGSRLPDVASLRAIPDGHRMFRELVSHGGGTVVFDADQLEHRQRR